MMLDNSGGTGLTKRWLARVATRPASPAQATSSVTDSTLLDITATGRVSTVMFPSAPLPDLAEGADGR